MDNRDGTIKCPRCGEPKPATAKFFYHRSASPNGFDYLCKEHRNEANQKYRETKEGAETRRRINRESSRRHDHARKVKAYANVAGIIQEHADSVLRELGLK